MSFVKKVLGSVILISLVGFFVYSFNLNNPLFWDDDDWIIGNTYVHDFSHVKEIFTENMLAGFGLNSNYYRPLLSLSFAFNYSISGTNPVGYHLLSNLFHISSAVLVFFLLIRVFKNRGIALLASIGWLIHPIHVESVAYISGRGDSMSFFFILLALNILFWKESVNWKSVCLASFVFLCGLMSRETAIVLPALIILLGMFIYEDSWRNRLIRVLRLSIPFWIIGAIYFILRLTVLNFDNTLNFYPGENIYSDNIWFRLLTFLAILPRYILKIFWPTDLHMEPNVPYYATIFSGHVLLGIALVVAILAVGYYLFIRKKYLAPVWIFGWLWFFITISPASGLIPINAIMYYHWLYIPMLGIMAILGAVIYQLWDRIKNTGFKPVFVILLLAYSLFWIVLNINHNILWGNEVKFYEYNLKYNPESLRIINNLANAYAEKGKNEMAKELYLRAINISGDAFAQPHYNLGNQYRDLGDLDKAIASYLKAIEVDPNFHFAYRNLTAVYLQKNELGKAIESLSRVRELMPQDVLVVANLGVLKARAGMKEEARKDLETALRMLPIESQEYLYIKNTIDQL